MNTALNPINYYRLPWTLNDNILAWLEPTKRCNLYCEGCYSRNDKNSDKTLDQIRSDLDVLSDHRRVDSISIAGGDPLVHPDIVEIVRMIRHDYGLKPVLNTNGLALTPQLLKKLKIAGVYGFTFHIDSSQSRPGWKGKNELELNELRLHYARMLAKEGGIGANFNSTVFSHTIQYIPEMLQWANRHIDIVNNMVFILFRTTVDSKFDYYANGEKIDTAELIYYDENKNPKNLTAQDVVTKIREVEPNFDPCAYLGGTKDPTSFKWLVSGRIGDKERVYGYIGKRFMELVQAGHHLIAGRYLAYSDAKSHKHGRSLLLAMSPFDKGIRKAASRYMKRVLRSPSQLASRLHFQSIVIIQPIDMMLDGATNMCDGCPDITVHNGDLVWSCRLEERLKYGCFLSPAPKKECVNKKPYPSDKKPKEAQTTIVL